MDDHLGTYFPGQMIHGRVVVEIDKLKTIKGAHVTFVGKGTFHSSRRTWVVQEERLNGALKITKLRKITSFDLFVWIKQVKNMRKKVV